MRTVGVIALGALVWGCADDGAPASTSATTSVSASTSTSTSTFMLDGTGVSSSGGAAPEDVLDADRVLNIAHAGGKGTRPEHTMVAYDTAVAEGADVLELDVHATSDGVLVLMHDDTVDRTTNGTGAIKDITLDALRELDAGYTFTTDDGATFPYRGMDLVVPTLEEVFEAHPDVAYVIEIKQAEPSIVAPFLAMCDDHGISDQMVASAFSQDVLLEVREAAPDLPTNFAVPEVLAFMTLAPDAEATYTPPARFLQVPPEQAGIAVLTPELVERAARFDLKVHAWTIKDEAEMQALVDMGVDGIITDYPARLHALLGP